MLNPTKLHRQNGYAVFYGARGSWDVTLKFVKFLKSYLRSNENIFGIDYFLRRVIIKVFAMTKGGIQHFQIIFLTLKVSYFNISTYLENFFRFLT